jgi:DDE superfamily endonuclease
MYRPEKDTPDNKHFNYWVSRVRVKSEHCVGYIKGRFCSLRGLRIQINQPHHLKIASLWITACIAVHCFAMTHEAGQDISADEFFREGLRIVAEERTARASEEDNIIDTDDEISRQVTLLEGKVKREQLKEFLLERLHGEPL